MLDYSADRFAVRETSFLNYPGIRSSQRGQIRAVSCANREGAVRFFMETPLIAGR